MSNYTQTVVEPASHFVTYWTILWYPFTMMSQMYERYFHTPMVAVVDTVIYCGMSCFILVLALTEGAIGFLNKAHDNVRLIRKFFQLQMYKNIN
ncbi:CIC11C00000003951 [Sungouiella intermedia]|uniref:CIC11C00000003951 n=1 Tax=Sungouiella intermedia TaxID=45354 RepID=A0A1L0DGE9_9ASCO|nr:CIC11C00000003951 [[Candida] intermedia]